MLKEKCNNFISLCSDTTFKYLYKNEKYKKWFDEIIFYITDVDLSNFILIDNEMNTGNNIKDYRTDIRLKFGDTTVIIEMNNFYYNYLDIKNYQYLYREAGNMFTSNENFTKKYAKLINLNNFIDNEYKSIDTSSFIFTDIKTGKVRNEIESFEIYLPIYKKSCYHNVNKLDKRLALFSCKSFNEMKNITDEYESLLIIEELERLSMDYEFMNAYDNEIIQKKCMNSARFEGYEEGIEKGKLDKQKEVIKNMLDSNFKLDDVSKATKLSIEEINKLINSNGEE